METPDEAGELAFLATCDGPTRWGNQLNGNYRPGVPRLPNWKGPHSLGQSVEWKPSKSEVAHEPVHLSCQGPTRWGNQLNGNTAVLSLAGEFSKPHSLGQSVEWKPILLEVYVLPIQSPTRWGNQLNGNSIKVFSLGNPSSTGSPTRWGNQLNGNCHVLDCKNTDIKPHSLGQSVEWKLTTW